MAHASLSPNGLEFWRKLCAEFQPRSPVRAAKLQVQFLSVDSQPIDKLSRALQRIDDRIMLHDSMADVPMHDSVGLLIYTKLAPPELIKLLRATKSDMSTASKFKQLLLEHTESTFSTLLVVHSNFS